MKGKIKEEFPESKSAIKSNIEEVIENDKLTEAALQSKVDENEEDIIEELMVANLEAIEKAKLVKNEKQENKKKDISKKILKLHKKNKAVSFEKPLKYHKFYLINLAGIHRGEIEEIAKLGSLMFDTREEASIFLKENSTILKGFSIKKGTSISSQMLMQWVMLKNAVK